MDFGREVKTNVTSLVDFRPLGEKNFDVVEEAPEQNELLQQPIWLKKLFEGALYKKYSNEASTQALKLRGFSEWYYPDLLAILENLSDLPPRESQGFKDFRSYLQDFQDSVDDCLQSLEDTPAQLAGTSFILASVNNGDTQEYPEIHSAISQLECSLHYLAEKHLSICIKNLLDGSSEHLDINTLTKRALIIPSLAPAIQAWGIFIERLKKTALYALEYEKHKEHFQSLYERKKEMESQLASFILQNVLQTQQESMEKFVAAAKNLYQATLDELSMLVKAKEAYQSAYTNTAALKVIKNANSDDAISRFQEKETLFKNYCLSRHKFKIKNTPVEFMDLCKSIVDELNKVPQADTAVQKPLETRPCSNHLDKDLSGSALLKTHYYSKYLNILKGVNALGKSSGTSLELKKNVQDNIRKLQNSINSRLEKVNKPIVISPTEVKLCGDLPVKGIDSEILYNVRYLELSINCWAAEQVTQPINYLQQSIASDLVDIAHLEKEFKIASDALAALQDWQTFIQDVCHVCWVDYRKNEERYNYFLEYYKNLEDLYWDTIITLTQNQVERLISTYQELIKKKASLSEIESNISCRNSLSKYVEYLTQLKSNVHLDEKLRSICHTTVNRFYYYSELSKRSSLPFFIYQTKQLYGFHLRSELGNVCERFYAILSIWDALCRPSHSKEYQNACSKYEEYLDVVKRSAKKTPQGFKKEKPLFQKFIKGKYSYSLIDAANPENEAYASPSHSRPSL